MRALIRLLPALLCTAAFAAAHAQGYPTKPVRLVVPYSAGGGADTLARVIAQRLTDTWSQQVLVENRPGANTQIGSEYVAKSAADGHTLLFIETSLVINPSLYKSVPYDPFRDFVPVTGLVAISQALVVHPALPVKNVQDLVALARSKPGELAYASFGLGSTGHLNMEMLQGMAGIKLNHIQYKGTAPALVDVAGGHVQMMFSSTGGVLPQTRSGKIRMIAVGSSRRLAQFPDVPTVAESGFPGFEALAWFGLVAPARTPAEIVAKVHADIQRVLADTAFREKNLVPQAFEPMTGTPEQFGAFMKTEAVKWGQVARAAKVTLD